MFGDGDPGMLDTLSSKPSRSLRDTLSRNPLAPELHLLPSTALRTKGLPLIGDPKPLVPYGEAALRPANGEPDIGEPFVLRSSGDEPNTAACVLLVLRGMLRAKRGGVMKDESGVAGADDGARPRSLRCEGVRGMSAMSSLRVHSGVRATTSLRRR